LWVRELTGQTFTLPKARASAQTLLPGDEAFVIRRVTRREQDWKRPFDPAVMELGVLRYEVPPPVKPTHKRGEKRHVIRHARARRKA
jgi:hypothetical protein